MKRYLSHSILALSTLTIVGFLIHFNNASSVAHANLHTASPIAPIAELADSLRGVTLKLDDKIVALHTEALALRGNMTLPVASTELQDLTQHSMSETEVEIPGAEPDAFQLNNRIEQQQAYIRSLGTLVEQQRDMFIHVPMLTPVNGVHTSPYGVRVHPITGVEKLHAGMDIAARTGTPIHASGAGVVTFSGVQRGYGNVIEIDHGYGYRTLYGHASKLLVQVGDTIQRGQLIALVGSTGGSTGPHLHYEVMVDGAKIDPSPFLLQPLREPATYAAASSATNGSKVVTGLIARR